MKKIFLGLSLLVTVALFSCRAQDHSHPNDSTDSEEVSATHEEGHEHETPKVTEAPVAKDSLSKAADTTAAHH
jgi:hypothetical protein